MLFTRLQIWLRCLSLCQKPELFFIKPAVKANGRFCLKIQQILDAVKCFIYMYYNFVCLQ